MVEKDNLKILLQKVELEEPSANFTAEIMTEITVQNHPIHNPVLKSVLQNEGAEILPEDFTYRVMMAVKSESSPLYKPIITKKGWFVIVCSLIAILILLTLLGNNKPLPRGATSYFMEMGNVMTTLVKNTSSLFILTFLSVSILLIIDYFLKWNVKTHETDPSN